MKKVVHTSEAPGAIGPYSQAIKTGDFLFLSGQIPVDPASGEIAYGGIKVQTHQVFSNLKAVLAAENLSLKDVVKTMVFLDDMSNFQAMNEIYSTYFKEDPPARSCVQVSKLPRDVAIEIELIAVYPK